VAISSSSVPSPHSERGGRQHARLGAQSAARPAVAALLLTALTVGALLRLWHLGVPELSPDEAASWAAAAAPTVAGVVKRSAQLNPGKLAAYDLVLHGWIWTFGDAVLTMRLLSVGLGVGAIALAFWVAREALLLSPEEALPAASTDYAAAVTALLFAVSLAMVKYTREARMYPLVMAAALAQTGFLLRAHRRGGQANYAAVALFTVLSMAANFTAVFLAAAQALWLVLSKEGRRYGFPWRPLLALAAGAIALAPALGLAIRTSATALAEGALNWISPPSWWSIFSFFNRSAGTFPFPVLLALAVWGAVAQWRRRSAAIVFALFWMWGPVLMLYLMSIAVTPLLVERYALSSLVAFMLLAALGIDAFASARMRTGAIAIAVAVCIAHVGAFLKKPPSLQWTHALAHIETGLAAGAIAVAPGYGANVLRYYLKHRGQYQVSGLTPDSCAKSDVLFLWDHAATGPGGAQVAACRLTFSHPMFAEKDVAVMTR
jgi:hypothetical protein